MPQRQFLDSHGQSWSVWDVLPSRVTRDLDAAWLARHGSAPDEGTAGTRAHAFLPDRFAGGWLCFERGGEKLRLAPVPAGWDRLTSMELESLCDRASTVRARTPRTESETRLM